jgi:hypothetical protein
MHSRSCIRNIVNIGKPSLALLPGYHLLSLKKKHRVKEPLEVRNSHPLDNWVKVSKPRVQLLADLETQ